MGRKRIRAAFFATALGLATILAMGQASITRGRNTLSNGATTNGTLTTNTTSACTIADTNETDLWTYSLPANTLNANGRGVRITAWLDTAITANNKTAKLYFGGTLIKNTGVVAWNNQSVVFQGVVIRTGASAELAAAFHDSGSGHTNSQSPNATPAENTANAITIKVTGTNGTAAANDICFKGAIVETIN